METVMPMVKEKVHISIQYKHLTPEAQEYFKSMKEHQGQIKSYAASTAATAIGAATVGIAGETPERKLWSVPIALIGVTAASLALREHGTKKKTLEKFKIEIKKRGFEAIVRPEALKEKPFNVTEHGHWPTYWKTKSKELKAEYLFRPFKIKAIGSEGAKKDTRKLVIYHSVKR